MKLTSIQSFFYTLNAKTGRNIPTDRFDEVMEYIIAGIKKLQTPYTKIKKSCVLQIEDYEASFPKDYESTISITRNKQRLRKGNSDILTKDIDKINQQIRPEYDKSEIINTLKEKYKVNTYKIDRNYYTEDFTGFNFTFEEGEVLLTYYAYPVDDKGLLKIPDSTNYFEALYWDVVSNLLLTGWKHPANVTHQYAQQQFEQIYGPRAISEMKRFSPEDAETLFNSVNRMILPVHHYRDYWVNAEQTQAIDEKKNFDYFSNTSNRT